MNGLDAMSGQSTVGRRERRESGSCVKAIFFCVCAYVPCATVAIVQRENREVGWTKRVANKSVEKSTTKSIGTRGIKDKG